VSVSVDIVSEPDVRALYAEIQKVFGRSADVLINNAGAKAGEGFLGDVVWDEFTRVVNTHFLGAALMARYFVSTQAHPKDPVGTIVYITSGIGGMMLPGAASYSIAKLAGQRLMEYMDAECVPPSAAVRLPSCFGACAWEG
jgi:NAD(P)-dependent dehydrogenase (short-subunit alcohol dehydrogenase family)